MKVNNQCFNKFQHSKRSKIHIFIPGVRRNRGRLGAKNGPSVFRERLTRTGTLDNPEFDIDLKAHVTIFDLGDVSVPNFSNENPFEDLLASEVHQQIEVRVKWAIENNIIPVVIGGGNDQSYSVAKAVLETLKSDEEHVGVINVDAHLDVRPLIDNDGTLLRHSGSPFRLLLDDPSFKSRTDHQFVEFGAQGSQCSKQHANFVRENNGRIIWLNELRGGIAPMSLALSRFTSVLDSFGTKSRVFLSFDIDSIRSSDCPGVSCPSSVGLTAEEALVICKEAGSRQNIIAFDMSEFNPLIESDRTSRLMANMFYYFCLGLTSRF
jgi:formiminoglutamase